MGAQMVFHGVSDTQPVELDAGNATTAKISAAPGNHPNGVWAYRVDHDGHSVVYATDTEHYAVVDPKLAKLAQGADVLIYDAQYTPEEYAGVGGSPKLGWGHSTFEEAARLAKAASVKKLVLYHHDPMQNDAAVAEKEKRARALFPSVEAAREGLVLEL
jgi:ribonuclease BN (tRNA processing enzyme)